ncbi:hypothetical protein VMCG_04189 [Cytospora schulzeri]|uniref:Uncharacterized protein n=1 Tax=Cytospora schulzeri TaxID=448051 RepID=A0A423WT90_9PEZI|nr:hypothetical protein VMCG_04189 [Valsa malicola]
MLFRSANYALLAAAAYLAGFAVADNCQHNVYYCGKSIMRKGDYYTTIVDSLSKAGQPTDEQHVTDSLFLCMDDDNVPFKDYCANGCTVGPSDGNDYCP